VKIRLSDFGYKYDSKRETNPAEAKYVKGMPGEKVMWGMCFEEPRTIGDVVVRLAEDCGDFDSHMRFETFTPSSEWINSKNYSWHKGHFDAYPGYPEKIDNRTFVYRGMDILTSKVRFRGAMPWERHIPEMDVAIYGINDYEEVTLFVETGLWEEKAVANCLDVQSATIEKSMDIFKIYNGEINWVKKIGFENGAGQHIINLLMTNKRTTPQNRINPDRTVLTVATGCGDVSFLPADLNNRNYIQIPDFGVLAYKNESDLPDGIRENVIYTGEKIRDRVKKMPQRTYEMTLDDIGLKPVNTTPETTNFKWHEPKAVIDIPDSRMKEHWHNGLSHMLAFCNEEESGKWNVRIGPYPMFGTESSPIIKMLDFYDLPDITIGALEKFLDSYSLRTPEGPFRSKEGCLCIGYGIYPDDAWQPHEPAFILLALAEHYFAARDGEWWLKGISGKIFGCMDWIYNEIGHHSGEGAWDDGLLPPARQADVCVQFSSYQGHAAYYMALDACNKALCGLGGEYAAEIEKRMPAFEKYRKSLKRAYRKNLSLAPVVPLRDGTFVPAFATSAYMRGFMADLWPLAPDNGLRNAWMDIDFVLCKVVEAGVFKPDDIETRWILDSFEDHIALDDALLPKKWDTIGPDPITRARDATSQSTDYDAEKDWFAWGGTGWQNGYCPLIQTYLITGEVNAFLRSFYNTYAIHADPDTYWFREHACGMGYPPKTFEEAFSLYRLRGMLVFEHDDVLYLNRCVPDSWFEKGFKISAMPTFFGKISMNAKAIDGGVRFDITLDRKAEFEKIVLRAIVPGGAGIKSVIVNGVESNCYDPGKGEIYLDAKGGDYCVVVG